MTRLQWDKAARQQLVRERGGEPLEQLDRVPSRKLRGISNDQARELARLQRQLGERYTGSGMTAAEADDAIRSARRRLAGMPSGERRRSQMTRDDVRGFRCPQCGAAPGEPCIGARTPPQPRTANHAARVAAAQRYLDR